MVANQVFTITATWSPPLSVLQDGVILGYEVNITRTPVSSHYVNTAFSSTPVSSLKLPIDHINIFLHYTSTFVVTGLQSYMSHTVSVEPYTKKGNGVTPTSAATTTMESAPTGPPQSLTTTSSTQNPLATTKAVTLSWSPPQLPLRNGEIRGFDLSYVYCTDDARLTTLVSATTTVQVVGSALYIVSGLTPYVNYTFVVCGHTRTRMEVSRPWLSTLFDCCVVVLWWIAAAQFGKTRPLCHTGTHRIVFL